MSESQIRTAFAAIEQDIINRGTEKLGSSIDNLDLQVIDLIIINRGNTVWEVFPKIKITGSWTAPPQTIDNRFDDYLQSLRGIYTPVVLSLGGSGAGFWHIHPVESITRNIIIQSAIDEAL